MLSSEHRRALLLRVPRKSHSPWLCAAVGGVTIPVQAPEAPCVRAEEGWGHSGSLAGSLIRRDSTNSVRSSRIAESGLDDFGLEAGLQVPPLAPAATLEQRSIFPVPQMYT